MKGNANQSIRGITLDTFLTEYEHSADLHVALLMSSSSATILVFGQIGDRCKCDRGCCLPAGIMPINQHKTEFKKPFVIFTSDVSHSIQRGFCAHIAHQQLKKYTGGRRTLMQPILMHAVSP
jgi:hypothetical protein